MTLEFVKQQLDRWLEYAKTPNNGFLAEPCYHTAYGIVNMAANLAFELKEYQLSDEIVKLWDDTYRELFLQAYRGELNRQ